MRRPRDRERIADMGHDSCIITLSEQELMQLKWELALAGGQE